MPNNRSYYWQHALLAFCFALLWLIPMAHTKAAEPRWEHALILFGEAKYAPSFKHFEYANPDAPKGGTVKLASTAAFDSLNSFILKGVKATGLEYLYDTLMVTSQDEPQSFYPLLAKRYRWDKDAGWIEFELNPSAQWHDGTAVTVEDIIWTLNTLKTNASPIYRLTLQPLKKAVKTGKHRVKFFFTQKDNREAPILAATLPVLPKHYYETTEFNKTTLTPPLGSGPYRISKVDVGRSLTFERVKDYWGKDLPVNRGRYNFDTIHYDVYRDATVQLEALKAGAFDIHREYISRNWATAYDFPAIADGRMLKIEIPHRIPQGMQAFFFNVRQPALASRAVRQAIAYTMDFEWINKALFYGAYVRNTSFFQNTTFEAQGLPSPEELALLEPFRPDLPQHIFTQPPSTAHSDGSGQNRENLLKAQKLLQDAGYILKEGKRIDPQTGKPLEIEFMLNQPTMQRVIMPMLGGLKKLGITGKIRLVDDAQYQQRFETRDFDIVSHWINLGIIFPGVEQMNYWHSSQANLEGSYNITGLQNPAVDALLTRITNAQTLAELRPAARALDRVLLAEQVVIPHWHSNTFRMAFWDKFGRPQPSPPYGLAFDSWWIRASDTPSAPNS